MDCILYLEIVIFFFVTFYSRITIAEDVLQITTILDPPFLMVNLNETDSIDNSMFHGYCKDLAEVITNKINRTYKFTLVSDSKFGHEYHSPKGKWSGMIGELQRNEASLSISSMVMTSNRAKVVKFSLPVLSFQLGILQKLKLSKHERNLRTQNNHLNPLKTMTTLLWTVHLSSILVLLIVIYGLIGLIHFCDKSENASSPNNFLLLVTTTLRSNIFDCSKLIGGKIILCVFVIHIFFLLTSFLCNYSANLVKASKSAKTHKRMTTLEEIINDNMQIGAVRGGQTAKLLKESRNQLYKEIFYKMSREDTFVFNNGEGIDRVLKSNGSFALLMEDVRAKYLASINCGELQTAQISFGPTRYIAIAISPSAQNLVQPINSAIVNLRDSGDLERLENKWFGRKNFCSEARNKLKRKPMPNQLGRINKDSSQMTLYEMQSIFYIVLIGVGFIVLITGTELYIYMYSKKLSLETETETAGSNTNGLGMEMEEIPL